MAQMSCEMTGRRPLVLTVPGLNGSGPSHWQTLWEHSRTDCVRLDLGMWDHPRRNPWVSRIDQSVRNADVPIILVAHSLGCLAVAWWAELAGQPWGAPIAGALLVAPPDVSGLDACAAVRGFGPAPKTMLPFPSIVVASENDPYAELQCSFDMARNWGSAFIDIGEAGHINAESALGLWQEGQALLERLIAAGEEPSTGDGAFISARVIIGGVSQARG